MKVFTAVIRKTTYGLCLASNFDLRILQTYTHSGFIDAGRETQTTRQTPVGSPSCRPQITRRTPQSAAAMQAAHLSFSPSMGLSSVTVFCLSLAWAKICGMHVFSSVLASLKLKPCCSYHGRDAFTFSATTENLGLGGTILPNRVYTSFSQVRPSFRLSPLTGLR